MTEMKLTKHAHACVVVETADTSIVLDPGTFTPDAATLLATADALLITHDHFDHFDEKAINAAMAARPELQVFAPVAVTEKLQAGAVTAVMGGEEFTVGSILVRTFGSRHAAIHGHFPDVANIGYLVGEAIFHPGDAYLAPGVAVDTLLVPTSGPWTKLGDSVDFIRVVDPTRAVQIHELMLSEMGQESTAALLGVDGLTHTPFRILHPGESITVPSKTRLAG